MRTLKVEDIAGYIPWKLKIQWTGKEAETIWELHPTKDALDSLMAGDYVSFQYLIEGLERGEDYKLVLHPLSDLKKEIKHNGDRFVPIKVLGRLYEPDRSFEEEFFGWNASTGGDDYEDYYFVIKSLDDVLNYLVYMGDPDSSHSYIVEQQILPYTYIEKLHEWHFDTSGLIEDKLAIDINTIDHEK